MSVVSDPRISLCVSPNLDVPLSQYGAVTGQSDFSSSPSLFAELSAGGSAWVMANGPLDGVALSGPVPLLCDSSNVLQCNPAQDLPPYSTHVISSKGPGSGSVDPSSPATRSASTTMANSILNQPILSAVKATMSYTI